MGRLFLKFRSKIFFSFLILAFTTNTADAKCVYLEPIQVMKMDVGNLLTWSTVFEEDIEYFIIQKSSNGRDFKKVGDIKGAGFSKRENKYRFLDFSSGDKKLFYRILLLGSDGNQTVSEIFHLRKLPVAAGWKVSSNQNTVTKMLTLDVQSEIATSVNFEIKNSRGQIVQRGQKKITRGANEISLNCKNLRAGEYRVVLWTKKIKETISMIKV